MGLAARAFELEGIATSVISWNSGNIRSVLPPRTLITRFKRGEVLGPADKPQTHIKTLRAALKLFKETATIKPVLLE